MAPNVGSLKQQYHMWLGLSFRRSAMTWSRQLRKRRVTTCLPLNFNKHHRICSFWAPMLAMMIRGMGVEICVRAVLKRMCLSHRNISWIENNVLVWASKEPKHHVCMCVCVWEHTVYMSRVHVPFLDLDSIVQLQGGTWNRPVSPISSSLRVCRLANFHLS